MKRTLIVLLVAGLTVGCSSNQVKIPSGTKTVETFKESTVDLPEWYVSVPNEDNAIYAAVTETSSDMQFAIDKAMLSAKREISFKLHNDISQKYTEHSIESNYSKDEKLSKETDRVVVASSNHINLIGVQKIRTEVVREGNKYRAFLLARYGLDTSNKLNLDYINKQKHQEAKTQVDKFERELTPGVATSPLKVEDNIQ
jgi:hypothetical protein